jgi:hypothetical protein
MPDKTALITSRHIRQRHAVSRVSMIIVICLALTLLALAAATLRHRTVSRAVAAQGQTPAPPMIFSVENYAPPDLPVILADSVLVSERGESKGRTVEGPASLSFKVTGRQSGITEVTFEVMEFDAAGRLIRVDGYVRGVGTEPGKPAELTLDLRRKVAPETKLVLSAEKAGGSAETWETPFSELAKTVAGQVTGKRQPDPAVKRESGSQPGDSGATLCLNGFRRATELTQSGEPTGVTSFTCDQSDRSFTFTLSGKTLVK